MEKYIEQILAILVDISKAMLIRQNYGFWIELLSILILTLTLYWLIKYTKATQGMKKEMIHQRVIADAADISFNMRSECYISDNTEVSIFGELKTPITKNSISKFVFLDADQKPIGWSTIFQKSEEKDSEFFANYFIKEKVKRRLFLQTLNKQGGDIKAGVSTTNGNQFIYTFRTVSDNWRKTLKGDPNLSDLFVLVKKQIVDNKK